MDKTKKAVLDALRESQTQTKEEREQIDAWIKAIEEEDTLNQGLWYATADAE